MTTATHILYYATFYGYYVAAYDDNGQPVQEYRAGNHPGDSQAVINKPIPGGAYRTRPAPLQLLKKWAKQTALETAAELGIDPAQVCYDQDGADSELELMESIT